MRWVVPVLLLVGCGRAAPEDSGRSSSGDPEICVDGVDNDGDGLLDCADEACRARCDLDGDGYDGVAVGGADCDDHAADVHPDVTEVCNTIDDDCDDLVDDADPEVDGADLFADADEDGWGGALVRSGCLLAEGEVQASGDCDDADPARHPGAAEVCGGLDEDCDALVDDEDPDVVTDVLWYADVDEDGAGDPEVAVAACLAPAGTVAAPDDCDDADPELHPGTTWYLDADVDGFGDVAATLIGCSVSPAWIRDHTDCDDADPHRNPTAVRYVDVDEDGYGLADVPVDGCSIAFSAADAGDCDDLAALVYPGAPELCDGLDNDCDLAVDDATVTVTWYVDDDGDGSGDPDVALESCAQPRGYVVDGGDCDDGDPLVADVCITCPPGASRFESGAVVTAQAETVQQVAGADLDGDGDVDLVHAAASLTWSENVGDGVFAAERAVDATFPGASTVETLDVDLDGDVDVVAASASVADETLRLYLNAGDGTFSPRILIEAWGTLPIALATADLDGDADEDLVAAHYDGDQLVWYENLDGTFAPGVPLDAAITDAYAVRVADLDGDGDEDIAYANLDEVRWVETLGGGVFGAPQSVVVGIVPLALTAGDVEADGDIDLVTTTYDGEVFRSDNLGDGTFAPSVLWMPWDAPVELADLDRDGDADLVSTTGDEVVWFESTAGALSTALPVGALAEAWSTTVLDVNGDGVLDVLATSFAVDTVQWFAGVCDP